MTFSEDYQAYIVNRQELDKIRHAENCRKATEGAKNVALWAEEKYGPDWKAHLAPPPGLLERLMAQLAEEQGMPADYYSSNNPSLGSSVERM